MAPSPYIVDYSGDHAFVDGVETAVYVDPDANTDNAVRLRMGNLTVADLQGTVFAVAPGDVPFTVWTVTVVNGTLAVHGRLTVGGISYTVIGILSTSPDGAQTRIVCRKEQ